MSKKYFKYRTDFLAARNGYVVGAGSIFNIFGNYHYLCFSKSSQEADAKALASDWGNVGKDIKKAIPDVQTTNKEKWLKVK
jgi:hypothetical protein